MPSSRSLRRATTTTVAPRRANLMGCRLADARRCARDQDAFAVEVDVGVGPAGRTSAAGRSVVACWPAPARRPAVAVGFYSPAESMNRDESGAFAGSVWVWRSRESSIPGSAKPPEAVGWQQVSDALASAELYWLTTVRDDGRPHITPLVGAWVDGALVFCTGPEEQKAQNLNHSTAVAVTTGVNTWNDGLDVVVEGNAQRVTGVDILTKLADVIREKYNGDSDSRRPTTASATPTKVATLTSRMSSASRPPKCLRSRSHRTGRRRSASRAPGTRQVLDRGL